MIFSSEELQDCLRAVATAARLEGPIVELKEPSQDFKTAMVTVSREDAHDRWATFLQDSNSILVLSLDPPLVVADRKAR